MYHDRMLAARGVAGSAAAYLAECASTNQSQFDPNWVARPSSNFLAPLGEWFDEDFDLVGPEADALTEALLEKIETVDKRGRKRRVVDADRHRTFVRKLAANGFRAFGFHNPSLVAVRRKGDGYKGRATWLNGKAMKRETTLLQKAGLIEVNKGERDVASTTYRVTEAFLIEAMKARLTERNLVHHLPRERLVRVYRTNSQAGETVGFDHTADSRRWTAQLEAYNDFIARQDIGIDLSDADRARLTGRMNQERKQGVPRLTRPDLIRKCLFRQFNGGSFDAGGRLYGAWWINCPQDLRPLITINAEQTVELDFSGCAIRMLYHESKRECDGDPYFLEAVDACERENGFAVGHFREDIKRMTQALINGREGGYAERIKLPQRHTFKPYFTRPEVMAMIKEKHAPIAQTFQTGAWGRLQRADSDIALRVIGELGEKSIVALPIHDSFITNKDKEDCLKQAMIRSYQSEFGFSPVIK